MKRIDFLTDWQKKIAFGLGEVVFTKKDENKNVLSAIIMSTNQFENIIDYYWRDFRNLNENSLIYKYYDREYAGINEEWAVNNEVKIDDIRDFLNRLLNINENYETLKLVKKEHKFLIDFCQESIVNKTEIYFQADDY